MKRYPARRHHFPAGSHSGFAGSDEKADLLLLHLIRNQGGISTFVVDQASSSQPVELLMPRFLRGTGKAEIERHFTGKPCGDDAGRFGLDLKGKAAVQRTAVGRNCCFDETISAGPPQNSRYWQKSCSNEKIAASNTGQW